ncbi:hypothetical protein [Burkholderia stabilis]|uniref:hypothetical protein n=1 Tax=Burkholderia stabilis TaxID=95485 RepID=UPI0012FE621C|nr:hypothetical protein [Burkholderia stabilis]
MNSPSLNTKRDEFCNLDFNKIKEIFDSAASDRTSALELVANPDQYMITHLTGGSTSIGAHFHIQVDGDTYPADPHALESRFIFATKISINPAFREEVVNEARKPGRVSPKEWCPICEKCVIAIIE